MGTCDASRLSADQRELYDYVLSGGKRAVYWAHRRAGKGYVAACIASDMARDGFRVLWVSPNVVMARSVRSVVRPDVDVVSYADIYDVDPKEYAVVILDEPSECGASALEYILDIADEHGQQLVAIGTARRKGDGMEYLYSIGLDRGWLCMMVPMRFDHRFYDMVKRDLPGSVFDKEFLLVV